MIEQTTENRSRLTELSLSSLVGGIINDVQVLMKQETALARKEIAEELQKAKQAAISLGVGIGIVSIGGLLLMLMLVFLLNWAVPTIPLWASFGIIGGLLVLAGVALLALAKKEAESIHVVPERTAETMKENLQWIKNPTS
jgi:uncharacterized membrane protein